MLSPDDKTAIHFVRHLLASPTTPDHTTLINTFEALYIAYRRIYQHVPQALLQRGWSPHPADLPDEKIATTLTMLYLGGTSDLTAIHAALLVNGNHPDIDALVAILDAQQFPVAYRNGQPDTQTNLELRLLLGADDSPIRTDTLLRIIYDAHDAITHGNPPPDTESGNVLLKSATRILDTVTTLLYTQLTDNP